MIKRGEQSLFSDKLWNLTSLKKCISGCSFLNLINILSNQLFQRAVVLYLRVMVLLLLFHAYYEITLLGVPL